MTQTNNPCENCGHANIPDSVPVSVSDIYPRGYEIPDGYEVIGFRKAEPNEYFIGPLNHLTKAKCAIKASGAAGSVSPYPRIIVTPKESSYSPAVKTYIHPDGSVSDSTRPPMPTRAPEGYEFTGEFRKVNVGEWYTDRDAKAGPYKWLHQTDAQCGRQTEGLFWILRPIPPSPAKPTPESVYGTKDIKAPEGYTLGEFRCLNGYRGPYLMDNLNAGQTSAGIDNRWRYTLTPIPTPESVYGTKTPTPPKGYYLGEFRPVTDNDKFFLSAFTGKEVTVAKVAKSVYDDGPRYILHPIPTLHDIYGTDNPIIPEGYESTGEIRRLKEGDRCLSFPNNVYKATADDEKYFTGFRLILRKKPAPKRWLIEVEQEARQHHQFTTFGSLTVNGAKILSVTPKETPAA